MARIPSHKAYSPPSPRRRKSSPPEPQKKEKGRSRNACDRCKQKKVKCDGEGIRVCSICSQGDFHCHYAQKPHSEKLQYRKGYVEMVEEANDYYKTALRHVYDLFQDAPVFADLRTKYAGTTNHPTAQEIATASGVTSTGAPHEGGIESINTYLESQNKPMLVRNGEWDKVQTASQSRATQSRTQESSPQLSPEIMAVDSPSSLSEDEEDDDDEPDFAPLSPAQHSVHSHSHPNTPPISQLPTPPTLSHPTYVANGTKMAPANFRSYPTGYPQQGQQQMAYPPPTRRLPSNYNTGRQTAGTVCLADLDLHMHPSAEELQMQNDLMMSLDMNGLSYDSYLDNSGNGANVGIVNGWGWGQ